MDVHHETIVFEREFPAPPSSLFAAYVDSKAREKWSAPSPTAEVRIESSDVRTGGREAGRCGGKGDLRWTVKVIYHLVTPDRQITFTEELWDADQILTVALVTFDLRAIGRNRTALTLTDQVVSFVGAGAVGGHREGFTQSLANLERYLAANG